MLEDILFDSRHKFVYFDENKGDCLKKEYLEFGVDLNQPIPVYIKDNGLPNVDSSSEEEKYRIVAFHDRYYEFLIALSIIDTLINSIDKDVLNNKLKRLFMLYSSDSKMEINDIDDLRYVLSHDKSIYEEGYKKYVETSEINFVDDLLLSTVMLEVFLKNIKRAIGLKGYFCVIFDYDELSINSMQIINKYINSRCNGYLSINVLCGNRQWNTYYDGRGSFIQNIHDYTEIDYRNINRRIYVIKKRVP